MKPDRGNLLAAVWGFAEATVFFIVPDVLLSWIALRSARRAFIASLYALAGALAGGLVTWSVGRSDPETLRSLFAALPAIDGAMIAAVREQLVDAGLPSVFIGPLIGVPYKIYALEAGNLGIPAASFLLVSIPARLSRFLLVSAVVAGVAYWLRPRLGERSLRVLLLACWAAFYAWYLYAMP